jgi:hypothetical protein
MSAENRQQAVAALTVMIHQWWSGNQGRSAGADDGSISVAALRRLSGEPVRACGGVRPVALRSAPELRERGSDSAKYGPPTAPELGKREWFLAVRGVHADHATALLTGQRGPVITCFDKPSHRGTTPGCMRGASPDQRSVSADQAHSDESKGAGRRPGRTIRCGRPGRDRAGARPDRAGPGRSRAASG